MGETGAGVAVFLLIIVASKLVVGSVIATLGLLYLIGSNRLHRRWTAVTLGLVAGFAVSFIAGAAAGAEVMTSVFNLMFTVPPALLAATLWAFSRPERDGYRSNSALFAYVGLWVFLGLCVILLPFSLIG